MKIGVLGLQGDFREHIETLNNCGVDTVLVKRASDLVNLNGLVIPGGESTTISKLAKTFELFDPVSKAIANGLPTYGSCAGMILVADSILDPASGQETFGGIDMQVRRNAFGRQSESFEADIDFKAISGGPIRGVFIRAPWVERYEEGVEILASVEVSGQIHPVAVRQAKVLATAFHPELTGDKRVHQYFLENLCRK
ncbi:MAG: pyridoxal 5'-phosphate synthase glutaminase subunit PdxT [Actinomycetota bacterium]|jgi:pyridoxal 5'-phosphate synthase pdxT subunit|tara:strand:- start:49558 stop:50148 length:591 start_codon:yes stop_codon:yes gene_type:complete